MNGNSIVVDTNILIYLFNGNTKITSNLAGRKISISFITFIELMSSRKLSQMEKAEIRSSLSTTEVIHSNEIIMNSAATIRSLYNLLIPDAIIAATSQFLRLPLLTADKQFTKLDTFDVILFEL